MKKIVSVILSVMMIGAVLAGCRSGEPVQTVRIGLMQDVDSLPFIVAREAGYFKAAGVEVELVMFKSAADRDSAFQSGNVDGVVSDMLAAMLAVNGGFDVKITSHTDGRYIFLASGRSGAKSLSDLRGREIGLSSNTIIEYSIDAMLDEEGIKPEDIKKTPIPQIPLRLEMLSSGKIAGACLPDPLATLAQEGGAIPLSDTSKMGNTLGVVLFSQKSIDEKSSEIMKVYQAYEKAKEELNINGDDYRPILVEKAGFPEQVKDIIKFPEYKPSFIPPQSDFDQVKEWMKNKGLIKADMEYNSIINREFIR